MNLGTGCLLQHVNVREMSNYKSFLRSDGLTASMGTREILVLNTLLD